ncbi:MAG: carbohydrate ABC transporter permease [Oscillospiraceae bacterium]
MRKNRKPTSIGDRIFSLVNGTILIILSALCLIPFIYLIALSFSSASAATAGEVFLWPVGFTLAAYKQALQGSAFIKALMVSVVRVVLGVSINILLLILTAYPLSKSNKELPGRSVFSWFFIITMLVGGGLIPAYLMVLYTGLMDTVWALILPGAITAYNLTVMLNFFRAVPKELEESAVIDGANQFQILFRIYVPLSMAAIATMIVFCTVGHWNEWFGGLLYMKTVSHYPLMTYLQTVITSPDYSTLNTMQLDELAKVSSKTYQAAQIMISTVPILIIYPICQRYFVKGMTLGSLKG